MFTNPIRSISSALRATVSFVTPTSQSLWSVCFGLTFTIVPAWQRLNAEDSKSPEVAVVIDDTASALEQYAAKELCGYLDKLFGIRTRPLATIPTAADAVLLIGNPTTNSAIAKAIDSESWPPLTDQGLTLKRVTFAGKPALIVGGGSPQATLWSVYELVERWGVRYLLHGDVLPDEPGKFRLPPKDVTLEPSLRIRQWRVVNTFLCGPESWGMDDYRPVFNQLAKLKFNRILVNIWTYQPYLHLEHRGVARKSAWLSFGHRFPITDDMVGRHLFDNRPLFWNPDLPLDASYKEFSAAGETLIHNLMAHAHARGMKCVMPVYLTDFPAEFKELLSDSQPVHQLEKLTIVPGPSTTPDDPQLTELAATVFQTTIRTYPEVDYLLLRMPEFRQWAGTCEQAWKELDSKYGISEVTSLSDVLSAAGKRPGIPSARALAEAKGDIVILRFYDRLFTEYRAISETRPSNIKLIYTAVAEELFPILPRVLPAGSETLNFLAYTPARVVERREAIERLDTEKIPATLVFTLHDDNIGLLPALTTGSLHQLTNDMRQHGWAGFSTRYWQISDHDPCVTYIARAAWDETVTPESIYRDQVRAACGKAAVEDMLTMLRELEETSIVLEWHANGLAFPIPGMIMKHWRPGPMNEKYAEARTGYQRALQAVRRAREKTPEEKRDYVDYWISRLEFGAGYFDTIEAVCRAATAEKAGKPIEAYENTKDALTKARLALEAFARVARDQSDRGAIATLNEYVYRPLRTKEQEMKTLLQ